MQRGRKKGSTTPGSHMARLGALEVGENLYVDTNLLRYSHDMRVSLTMPSRRPEWMQGRKFKAALLTAVGSSAGDVSYLIRITRTK
jgi:hypothetical protein